MKKMKVRFKQDYVMGRVKVLKGDILDVPPALRDKLIEEGVAEDVQPANAGKEKEEAKSG